MKKDIINDKIEFENFVSKVKNKIDAEITYRENTDKKQCMNFIYWLNKYLSYLKAERTFKPQFLPAYPRGSIVKIDMGFNVGSEHGGVHFGVVLNKKDTKRSSVLTILPLASIKFEDKKFNEYEINLGDEFYNLVKLKFDSIINKNNKDIEEYAVNKPLMKTKEKIIILQKLKQELLIAKDVLDSLSYLKQGTYGLLGQITTISKIRVSDPIKISSSLYGIQLSNNTMIKISKRISTLYC